MLVELYGEKCLFLLFIVPLTLRDLRLYMQCRPKTVKDFGVYDDLPDSFIKMDRNLYILQSVNLDINNNNNNYSI